MQEFIQSCFQMPVLPATLLVLLMMAYWLLTIFGILGVDMFDFDLDMDVDVDAADFDVDFDVDPGTDSLMDSALGLGIGWLNFLNIGQIPLTIWMSAFAIFFWVTCRIWPEDMAGGNLLFSILLVVGSAMISLLPTKLITQPFRGVFAIVQPEGIKDILGREGEVITAEVSQKLGQVRVPGETSPLTLTARTLQGVVAKGEIVRIVKHDPEDDVYLVERVGKKQDSEVI